MDEAGRCRRTDGKKWRCSKEVVPNEKYCEKHMHRGCSRKLVEYPSIANPNPSSSTSKPPNSMNNASKRPPPAFTSTEEKEVAGEKIDKKNSSNGSKVEEERLKTDTTKSSSNNKGGVAIGLEFSPKRRADELEPRRCRRTDGKRWRCAKEVVGKDHKYCAKHMHRGAKKRRLPEHGECNPYALVKRANKLVLGFDSS